MVQQHKKDLVKFTLFSKPFEKPMNLK